MKVRLVGEKDVRQARRKKDIPIKEFREYVSSPHIFDDDDIFVYDDEIDFWCYYYDEELEIIEE